MKITHINDFNRQDVSAIENDGPFVSRTGFITPSPQPSPLRGEGRVRGDFRLMKQHVSNSHVMWQKVFYAVA